MDFNKKTSLDVASLGSYAIKHITAMFFAVILILLVMEGYVIQNSIKTILGFDSQVVPVNPVSTPQINFTNYSLATKKVNDGQTYQATTTQLYNPFVPIPLDVPKP